MRGASIVSLVVFLSAAAANMAAGQEKTMPGPLSRAHAPLGSGGQCEKCHEPSSWKIEATRCVRCHQPIAARIAAKKGVHREVADACEACHGEHGGVEVDLRPLDAGSFDHQAETGFSLKGGHAPVAETCARCHTTRSYLGLTPQCSTCHKDGHNGGLGSDCVGCHTAGAAFRNASRAFHKANRFPLEGKHQSVACASCHLGAVTKGTPTRCYDCHWVRRQDDRYRTRLGGDCETCHWPTAWTAVRWNHSNSTGIALNAPHRSLGCESCHAGQVFKGAAVQCVTCHQADYQRTVSPNHPAAGFPTACDTCHQAGHGAWTQTTFNHSAVFTLVGLHAVQACSACHRGGVYRGTPQDCAGCHLADYQKTTSPNHQAAGFPTTCSTCHRPTDTSFRGASFAHGQAFPLVGVHATQACSTCHKNNVFKGTPRDCVACHLADYQRAANPNHQAAGFPTACETCHRATAPSFKGAGFAHGSIFPLVGVHATQPCSACHRNDVYRGSPRECVGCHLADYQRTASPNHQAAGFPTACDSCHRPSDGSWRQASFNHTWFPITSGRHAGVQCSSCHVDRNNYKVFSCLGCHTQSSTTSHHTGVGGFRYDSNACYSCHPTGRS